MKPEPIETLRKQHKDEWIVLRVTKTDKWDTPLEGEVIGHSPTRAGASEIQRGLQGDIMICFGGPPMKEGHIAILYGHLPL